MCFLGDSQRETGLLLDHPLLQNGDQLLGPAYLFLPLAEVLLELTLFVLLCILQLIPASSIVNQDVVQSLLDLLDLIPVTCIILLSKQFLLILGIFQFLLLFLDLSFQIDPNFETLLVALLN